MAEVKVSHSLTSCGEWYDRWQRISKAWEGDGARTVAVLWSALSSCTGLRQVRTKSIEKKKNLSAYFVDATRG
jgi:hypothetical protein